MYGVRINGIHSDELGLILTEKYISSPSVKTNKIEIPGRSGSIDLSEVLTGEPSYEDRTIKLTFYSKAKVHDWSAESSRIDNLWCGKTVQIVFDDDISYFWKGRVTGVQPSYSGKNETIEIVATVDPYKYDIISSMVDWEWDCFDFDNGIINEAGNLVVSGTTSFILICRNKVSWPEFTVSDAMTLTYDGITYNLAKGTQKLYRMFLHEGNNELVFNGNGTISINYVGGQL